MNERGKFMQAHLLHVSNHDAAKRRKWLQRCVQKMLVPHMHHSYLHTFVIAAAIVAIGQILQNPTLRNVFEKAWEIVQEIPGDSWEIPAPAPGLQGSAGTIYTAHTIKIFQNLM